MESLLSESKERAIEQVLLTVVSENKTAISLYEKWGSYRTSVCKIG